MIKNLINFASFLQKITHLNLDSINHLGIGILLEDGEGFIKYINKNLCELINYEELTLLGKNISLITPENFIRTERMYVSELLNNERKNLMYERFFLTRQGSQLKFRVEKTSYFDTDSNCRYLINFVSNNSILKTIENNEFTEQILLDTLMNHAHDSVYFKDRQSRFVRVNESTFRKFGFTCEEEILGKSDRDLFSNEHATNALNAEQYIINSGIPQLDYEEKETWPDGKETWVITSKYPIFNGKDEIVGTFGITRDITVQKQIEKALKDSQERFKNLSAVTFEGIVIHDKGIVLDANQSFVEISGYSLDEIIGKNIIELAVAHEDKKSVMQNVFNETLDPYEVVAVRKNGEKFIAEIEARNFLLNDKPVRVAAIRDVTERHRSEKIQSALYKISEAVSVIDEINELYIRIHEIVKTLMPADNFYIALFDSDSNTLSFPYFVDKYDPPPAPREFGNGLTEYILRTDQDMLINSELDKELRDKGETDLLGELSKIWLGVRLKVKDVLIGAIVLQDYENEDTYDEVEKEILIFVSEQIALAIDKKRSEEKLKKYSSELKELVASKDKFFSIVAHDLKSPFTALLGYSEMIANEYKEMTQDELKEFAFNMYDVAKKTFTLLENLLDWSRVQTGRMKFSPENISLFKISQQVVELYIDNARKKGIYLKNRVKPEHEVYADNNMLFTILRNLTSNAVKFTGNNDEITILSRKLDRFIEVTVHDTGIGINPEDLNKLFRIDVHHSEIGTEQEKGTGLGLILCNELIEKCGGTIKVLSKPGEGSSFIFTIPTPNEESSLLF